jgi:hypothetical protein
LITKWLSRDFLLPGSQRVAKSDKNKGFEMQTKALDLLGFLKVYKN